MAVGAQNPLWERGWGWERDDGQASQGEGDAREGLEVQDGNL